MKNLIFLFLLTFTVCENVLSQCCPYVDSITIIPTNPTVTDTIKIVTNTTTPNKGSKLFYTYTKNIDTFKIEGCFWKGILTQPKTFLDTTVIGVLGVGAYHIQYIAYSSSSPNSCLKNSFNNVTTTLTVSSTNDIENANNYDDLFLIYPNPMYNQLNIKNTSSKILFFRLYNTLGITLFDEKLSENITKIDISAYTKGIYYYSVYDGEKFIKSGMMFKP